MRYLGLDLGSKRLGVSLSDSNGIIATSYTVISHNEEYIRLIEDIRKMIEEKKVDEIVLGLPLNMNNTLGPKGELSYKFKDMLESNLNIKVNLIDERLTTKEAQDILIANNTSRKKRKTVIDSMAATIILQSYLDRNKKER